MPHPPVIGSCADSARPFADPTIPGLESSFARLALLQPGHSGVRSAVTNVSNFFPQSSHRYSNIGMSLL